MHDHPSGTPCVSFGGHIQVAFRFMSYGNLSWALPGAGADIHILAQTKIKKEILFNPHGRLEVKAV